MKRSRSLAFLSVPRERSIQVFLRSPKAFPTPSWGGTGNAGTLDATGRAGRVTAPGKGTLRADVLWVLCAPGVRSPGRKAITATHKTNRTVGHRG